VSNIGLESIYRLSVMVNMVDNLSGPSARINSCINENVSNIDRMQQSFSSMAKTGAVMSTLGAEITKGVLSPVKATFETKKALGELSSVGVRDLETLEKSARDFSDKWAGTTKSDFITAAYDIKSGISSLSDEAVGKYTEIAGMTAKGTKATTEEMTSLFATGYGIYKDFYKDMSDIEFGEMFSAGISKSVQQFKTTGSQMAQAISTLGASATSANVPLEEQLSILGMLQATMPGGEAGTKYKAFVKSAAKAGEELGLSFVDSNNQLLSMPEILTKLKGKFGETMDAAEKMKLQKAFGTEEAVQLVDLLYNKTGNLEENIISMNSSLGQGTNVAKDMADAINQTEGEQYELLKQQLHNVKEEIGNQLLPTVVKWMKKGKEILKVISDWIDKNQGLVKAIMNVLLFIGVSITIIGTLLAIIGTLGMLIMGTISTVKLFRRAIREMGPALKSAGRWLLKLITKVAKFGWQLIKTAANGIRRFVSGLWNMAKQAVITAAQAMPGLIASVWSFTSALLANPITWIVVGIIALIAVLYLLWKNWDKVSSVIRTVFNSSVNGAKAHINSLINVFKNAIGSIKNYILGKLGDFKNSGKKIMLTFVEGIKSMASKPYEAIKGALGKARKLLPFSDAKEGPLSTLTLSGRRVFETINTGMEQTKDLPYKTTNAAFSSIGSLDISSSAEEEIPKFKSERKIEKINLKEILKEEEKESREVKAEKDDSKNVTQNIYLNVDWSQIKDVSNLIKLIKDFQDYTQANVVTE
jgi:TP901 family phage tail tape measure protein